MSPIAFYGIETLEKNCDEDLSSNKVLLNQGFVDINVNISKFIEKDQINKIPNKYINALIQNKMQNNYPKLIILS